MIVIIQLIVIWLTQNGHFHDQRQFHINFYHFDTVFVCMVFTFVERLNLKLDFPCQIKKKLNVKVDIC